MALIELKLNGFASAVNVPTAGTKVPLSAVSLKVSGFCIQFNPANTGNVYLKDENNNICMVLNSGVPTANFMADDSEADEDRVVWDLSKVFIDASINNQSAYVSYYTLEGATY